MDCLYLLSQISMLGALLSNQPGRSIAVFDYEQKTFLASEGDFLRPGLLILKINARRRIDFKCGNETIPYLFSFSQRPEEPSEDQPPEEMPPEPSIETEDGAAYH